MTNEIQHYSPQPIPAPMVPPGMTVAYTPQGQPVYVPQQQTQPVFVQMPTQPIPAWLRNFLIFGVGLLILCTPAVVVLVVAAPALMAVGQGLAYGGLGIGVGVIGLAAAIKALRETPAPKK